MRSSLAARWVWRVFLVSMLASPAVLAGSLVIDNAWVRAMPPGQTIAALYLEVTNHLDQTCELQSVTTPAAGRTELHRTTEEAGMARMRHQDSLVIPSHGRLVMVPGGDHVMLFEVLERLEPGMSVPVEVEFGECGRLTVEAEVRDATGSGNGHHGHHHHH